MSFFKRLFKATAKYIKKKKELCCTAVIVAAGSASRMQGTDKIMAPLAGAPLILRTVRVFQEHPSIKDIVVVTREDLVEEISRLCKANNFDKVRSVVTGGADRSHSVAIGLANAPEYTTHVAIHDGARPLVCPEVIESVVRKAMQTGAAAPAVPVKDTVKIARGGLVIDTPNRAELYAVQTPQVFDIDLLRGALDHAVGKGIPITDDCSAVEKIGMRVHLVEGSEENIKITTPIDLTVADAILRNRGEIS